jgi:uncharacterized PurR-regulated membrane protein YhhQ (DUF165 family)
VTATDLPVQANRSPAGGGPIGRGLGALTPSGRASVPLSWALYDLANTIYSYAIVSYAIGYLGTILIALLIVSLIHISEPTRPEPISYGV